MQGERESDRGEVERVRETNIGKERREVAFQLLRAGVEDGEQDATWHANTRDIKYVGGSSVV